MLVRCSLICSPPPPPPPPPHPYPKRVFQVTHLSPFTPIRLSVYREKLRLNCVTQADNHRHGYSMGFRDKYSVKGYKKIFYKRPTFFCPSSIAVSMTSSKQFLNCERHSKSDFKGSIRQLVNSSTEDASFVSSSTLGNRLSAKRRSS